MVETGKFLPEKFNGCTWGRGRFFQLPPEGLTPKQLLGHMLMLAFSAGCPTPGKVIRANGVEEAAREYAITNKIFRQTVELARKKNNIIALQLYAPAKRLSTEPVKVYEEKAVPKNHLWRVAPLSRIYGFASSRLIRDMALMRGKPPEVAPVEDTLRDVLRDSNGLPSFLVRLADAAILRGVDVPIVFSYLFSSANLKEENTRLSFKALATFASWLTPGLWEEYERLKDACELKKYSIAEVEPDHRIPSPLS